MGKVMIVYRIYPEEGYDLAKLIDDLDKIEKVKSIKREPIAFGLEVVKIGVLLDDKADKPSEVEEQIALIQGVQHVAVVGIPDQKLGERICACIMPVPGYQLSPEKITGFCKENLANYKVPDFVEIMDSFPMTTTEKIQKFKIKDLMTEKYGKKGS